MHQPFLGRLSSLLFPTLFSFHFQVFSFPSPVPLPPASFVQPRSMLYVSSSSYPYLSFQLCLWISCLLTSFSSFSFHLHPPKNKTRIYRILRSRHIISDIDNYQNQSLESESERLSDSSSLSLELLCLDLFRLDLFLGGGESESSSRTSILEESNVQSFVVSLSESQTRKRTRS